MTSNSDANATDSTDDGESSKGSTDATAGTDTDKATPKDEASTPEVIDSELLPAFRPITDGHDIWQFRTPDRDGSTREVSRELTPSEVEIDQPEEFEFRYIQTEKLPTGIQYTPDFDSDWVYTSGSDDGGRQDDTPVQGLEIGVLATDETIEATVHAILNAVSSYYNDTGAYPRHRIIKSAEIFREINPNEVGIAAVLQPSPDNYDGLTDHMKAVQSGAEGAVDSNIETSRRIVQYLSLHLASNGIKRLPDETDIGEATGWETATQVGTTPIVEHYAPLGAAKVYNPNIDDLDLGEDGVASIADAEFTPKKMSIETNTELFDDTDISD